LFIPAEFDLLILVLSLGHNGYKRNYYFLIELNSRIKLSNHLLDLLNVAALVSTGQIGPFGQHTSVVFVAVEQEYAAAVVQHAAHIFHELSLESLPDRPLRKHPQGYPIVLVYHAPIDHEELGAPQTGSIGIDGHADAIEHLLNPLSCEGIFMDIQGDDIEDILPAEKPFLESDDFSNELSELFLQEAHYLIIKASLAFVERVDLSEVIHHEPVQNILLIAFLVKVLLEIIEHYVQYPIVLFEPILQVGIFLMFAILILHLLLNGLEAQQQSELFDEMLHLGVQGVIEVEETAFNLSIHFLITHLVELL
jgi:hypothetical protein